MESIPESVSSIERSQASTSAEKSQTSVSMLREGGGGIGEKTCVHGLIHFNGVKFANCLIDTESQVNLMPASHATRHGFACRRDGIREAASMEVQVGSSARWKASSPLEERILKWINSWCRLIFRGLLGVCPH